MKKIISAGLAAILAASALSTAAFAEEVSITAEGVLAKPAIKVTMPKSMAFVFNPYGLKVDIKGKLATAEDATDTSEMLLIGSYAYPDTSTTPATPAGTGWKIVNGTGAPLTSAIYAYSINADTSDFKVLDAADTTTTLAAKQRALKVALTAKGDAADAEAQAITLKNAKLDTKTANIWDSATNGSTVVSSFTTNLEVGFDQENTTTAKGTDNTVWIEKDAPKINFIFAFELAEGATTSSASFTGAPYTITFSGQNDAELSFESKTIAEDTRTTASDFPTITGVDGNNTPTAVTKYRITVGGSNQDYTSVADLIAYLDGLDTRANIIVKVYP